MNLSELAKLCGCTPSTVSKAFRNSPDLRSETKNRILDTAKEYGIEISIEQILKGRSVLALVPSFNNEENSRRLAIMQKKLQRYGVFLFTASTEYGTADTKTITAYARKINGLCGIVCFDSIDPQFACSVNVPIVTSSLSYDFDCIYNTVLEGYRQVVRYLVSQGRRRIAFVGENMTRTKEFCFRQAMSELAVPTDNRLIFCSELYSNAAGAAGFSKLFSLSNPPDAILCAYDYIALGVLNSAETACINVPHELAVIGADDIKAASSYKLGLTTLASDRNRIADTLVELLISRICDPELPLRQIPVPWELIVRETG